MSRVSRGGLRRSRALTHYRSCVRLPTQWPARDVSRFAKCIVWFVSSFVFEKTSPVWMFLPPLRPIKSLNAASILFCRQSPKRWSCPVLFDRLGELFVFNPDCVVLIPLPRKPFLGVSNEMFVPVFSFVFMPVDSVTRRDAIVNHPRKLGSRRNGRGTCYAE